MKILCDISALRFHSIPTHVHELIDEPLDLALGPGQWSLKPAAALLGAPSTALHLLYTDPRARTASTRRRARLRQERLEADDDEDDSARDLGTRTEVRAEPAADEEHRDAAQEGHDADGAAVKHDVGPAGGQGDADDERIDGGCDRLEEDRGIGEARGGALLGFAQLANGLDDHLSAHETEDRERHDARIRLDKGCDERAAEEPGDGHRHLKDGEHGRHGELLAARHIRLAKRVGQRDGHGIHGERDTQNERLDKIGQIERTHSTLPMHGLVHL